MSNEMWALGLIILSIIELAIMAFLIIKLIISIEKIVSESKKSPKKYKTKLYKAFVIFSIITCIFLPIFTYNMTSKFPEAYPHDESSSGVITSEISNQIAIYVWPILIIYLVILITLIVKKTNYRNVYYPLSMYTFCTIFFILSIIYFGYLVLWIALILLVPLLILLFLLAIIGKGLDNNTITIKNVVMILASGLLILFLRSILNFNLTHIRTEYTQNIIENKNEDKKLENIQKYEKIKEDFNNMIDSDFIFINHIMLDSDYTTIKQIEFIIINYNMPSNETDFCNALIDAYVDIKDLLDTYNYTNSSLHFKFSSTNPFAKEESISYKNSGHIKDAGNTYLIYLNPTPIHISK